MFNNGLFACSSHFPLLPCFPTACLRAHFPLCSHLNRKVVGSFTLIIDVGYASARQFKLPCSFSTSTTCATHGATETTDNRGRNVLTNAEKVKYISFDRFALWGRSSFQALPPRLTRFLLNL